MEFFEMDYDGKFNVESGDELAKWSDRPGGCGSNTFICHQGTYNKPRLKFGCCCGRIKEIFR